MRTATTFALTALWLTPLVIHATTPEGVVYKGTLFDNGQPANGTFQLRYELYDVQSGGSPISAIAARPVLVSDGAFSDDIGALFSTPSSAAWLEVSVEAAGGGGLETLPRVRVAAVPYSVRASVADIADSVEWTNVRNAPSPLQGEVGPSGPTGPTGETGPQGESVTCVAVDVGDANCEYGGTRCTVGNTIGYACNGAPGIQGPVGPTGPSGPPGQYTGSDFIPTAQQWCADGMLLRGFDVGGNALCTPDVDTNTTYTATEFVPTNQTWCAAGELLQGFDVGGNAVCAPDVDTNTTYTAADFVPTNQTWCAAGELLQGFDVGGNAVCAPDVDTTYTAADFIPTNQTWCAAGEVLRGFDAAGNAVCAPDANTTYSSTNFIPTNQTWCAAGEVLRGFDAAGNAVCVADATYTDALARAAMGALENTNPMNHTRYADADAKSAARTLVVAKTGCFESGYVNTMGGVMDYSCPGNSVMAGMYSYYNSTANDRQFRFRCCYLLLQ